MFACKQVYARSLKVVRPLLLGGYLRAGFLTAVDPSTDRSCAERCRANFNFLQIKSSHFPGLHSLRSASCHICCILDRSLNKIHMQGMRGFAAKTETCI